MNLKIAHPYHSLKNKQILFFAFSLLVFGLFFFACKTSVELEPKRTAETLLGNPNYPAISYGGYRDTTRNNQPSLNELMEDMRILQALGVRMLRTYNLQFDHAKNVLLAIDSLKRMDNNFEMYVMLGAWIDCKNAWTNLPPDHDIESSANASEIDTLVYYANKYPDIVKVLAVGNEAMVHWATSYYVRPGIILKWVDSLQTLKTEGKLSQDLWITSSDNFASWGGGSKDYHVPDLIKLIESVDYISMHTYPMHDTHYNPDFWETPEDEKGRDTLALSKSAMDRALKHAQMQYRSVKNFVDSLGIEKPIHIGETGWASFSGVHFGPEGSAACDEYKQSLYYNAMREWTNRDSISCFFLRSF